MYSAAKLESREVCEGYTTDNGSFVEAQSCSNYCCSTCKNRYCCSVLNDQLYQESCVSDNCTDFYDMRGTIYESADCSGRFCCGWCDFRYCCSFTLSMLDQSSCPTGLPNGLVTI